MKYLTMLLLIAVSVQLSATTYYVSSSSGNDANSGKSSSAPWKSLNKVQSFWNALKEGDTVLLKRGDVFYGVLVLSKGGTTTSPMVLGAYGTGSKPIMNAYKKAVPDKWVSEGNNIWRINLTIAENSTQNTMTTDADEVGNVGHLRVNGTIKGDKVLSYGEMQSQWQFYSNWNTGNLYVYSTTNPGDYAVQVAPGKNCISPITNSRVYDIVATGGGANGVGLTSDDNVIVARVDVKDVGGAKLNFSSDDIRRYGNGFQSWRGGSNIKFLNCTATNCYDVAFTCQGPSPEKSWSNILVDSLKASKCNQFTEFWETGATAAFKAIVIQNSRSDSMGFGWSAPVRYDKDVGVHMLFYRLETTGIDITYRNNIYNMASTALYHVRDSSIAPGKLPTGVKSTNNKIYIDFNQRIVGNQGQYFAVDYAKWQTASGKEVNSQFFVQNMIIQKVTSFTLVDCMTDKDMKTLNNGDVLNLATLSSKKLSIRANTNTTAGSVVFKLSGHESRSQTESTIPYQLFGGYKDDYYCWTPGIGSYTLKCTPYSSGNGTGTVGTSLTVNFSVIIQATSATQRGAVLEEEDASLRTTIKAFPNPSNQAVYNVLLPAKFQGEVTYTLVSSLGSKLATGVRSLSSSAALNFDFSRQMTSSGVYYLVVENGTQKSRVALILQK